MSNLRHRVGGKLEAMGDKLEAVEEKSKDLIHGFLGLFGRDGRIVSERCVIYCDIKKNNSSPFIMFRSCNNGRPENYNPAWSKFKTLCHAIF